MNIISFLICIKNWDRKSGQDYFWSLCLYPAQWHEYLLSKAVFPKKVYFLNSLIKFDIRNLFFILKSIKLIRRNNVENCFALFFFALNDILYESYESDELNESPFTTFIGSGWSSVATISVFGTSDFFNDKYVDNDDNEDGDNDEVDDDNDDDGNDNDVDDVDDFDDDNDGTDVDDDGILDLLRDVMTCL